MSDFLDTPVGSMNFKPPPRPKDGPTKPGGNTTPPPASTTPGSYNLNGQPIWGTSGGMVYQYGRDSTGRDTFGPGTDEGGNPLGNQDGTMIGSQDPRYGAAQAALAQHPGYVQVRVDQQGAPGGYNDPSQLVYDPTVGLITPVANIVMGPDDTGMRMAAVLAGPLLGMAGNAVFGAGEVIGPVAGGAGGGAGVGAVAGPVGATGSETVPEVLGPDGTMVPPGGPELTGPPVASPPIGDPTLPPPAVPPEAAPPPGAPPPEAAPPPGYQIPPPMEPVTAPPLDPMVPPYDPASVADGLTPTINGSIPPGSDITMPPLDAPPSTPDFNIPMQAPPNVDVPLPEIEQPWWSAPLDSITSHPLQAAGLGLTAYNAFNRPKPPTIDSNVPNTNKPVIDQAISDIMHKGALSSDQQHSIDGIIDQHIREGVEAINQRAINSGMGANSMVTQQQINQFKQNAEVARAQLYQQQMQQNISNAISVWAEGNREDIAIQTAAANLAMQNNQEIARLNQSISQSLGWLYSMSNSRSAPSTFPGG